MIPRQLIASRQLTDPGVNFASVHGLTPVTVHMSFSLPRDNKSLCEREVTLALGQSLPRGSSLSRVHVKRPSILVTFYSDSSDILRVQM